MHNRWPNYTTPGASWFVAEFKVVFSFVLNWLMQGAAFWLWKMGSLRTCVLTNMGHRPACLSSCRMSSFCSPCAESQKRPLVWLWNTNKQNTKHISINPYLHIFYRNMKESRKQDLSISPFLLLQAVPCPMWDLSFPTWLLPSFSRCSWACLLFFFLMVCIWGLF